MVRACALFALTLAACGGAPDPRPTPTSSTAAPWDTLAITDDSERIRVEVGPDMPSRGPANAPVTLVVFGDFQCPFTRRLMASIDALEALRPGQLRVVWRDQPLAFHEHAMDAAEVAREAFVQAGSDGFWRLSSIYLENQGELAAPNLETYAFHAGLVALRAREALRTHVHRAHVEADAAAGTTAGVTGTPTTFVNGRRIVGAQPLERFVAVVDEELGRAREHYAAGVPEDRYYAMLMRGALAEAPPEPTRAPDRTRREPDPSAIYAVPVTAEHPSRGPADALVTVVVFSDFQCPFCSRVVPTLERLQATYPADVRLVFRHAPLPFHDHAVPAALLSLAAFSARGSVGFWAMHDLLFENQRDLTRETLERLGAMAGLGAGEVRAALDEPDGGPLHARIGADLALATALDARGTPSFFINGRLVRGAQPYEVFAAVVEEERARALSLIAAGAPRADVYARAIAGGASAPVLLPEGVEAPPLPRIEAPPAPAAPRVDALPAPDDVARPPRRAIRTPSGLASRVLRPGTGTVHPDAGSRVRVHYTGWTTDGVMFDSSRTRGEAATFPVSAVISGFAEGVQLMVVGEERRLWIPADLAYGDTPRAGAPAGMLVFDIELVAIETP